VFYDRKPQTGPPQFPRAVAVYPVKTLEDPRQVFLGDAQAGVGDRDADFLFVTMGSLASEASEAVDLLREEGTRAGVVGLRVFRPFPARQLVEVLQKAKSVAVLEKAISYGYEGALATELKAALFTHNGHHQPAVCNFILGLGGKDVKPQDLLEAARDALQSSRDGLRQTKPRWYGCGI
jgi:pyruvate/2-oxoacid:ferredoxin oxidoreductase alpha subunit